MNGGKKNPVSFELDFDQTKIKELERKLLSGELTFEEWEQSLQEDFDKMLSSL